MPEQSSSLQVRVLDGEGAEHLINCKRDMTLMEVIRGVGLPMEAACGGSLACATCHVIIAEEFFERVGPPSEDEEDMLDQGFNVTRTSRLACQITMVAELDRLQVRLPPKR